MTRINLVSGNQNDDATVYTVGASATARFTSPVSDTCALSLQVVYANLNGADSVFKIQGSNDGVHFDDFTSGTETISTTDGSFGWETKNFTFQYVSVLFTKGTSTGGTFKLLATRKEIE